ncbi:ABC transporter ATP-binding protein [Chitinispirillales bacterium ANBcel5]|uniref:ABC transporter ATP-binding protein n=1 Tax=Cellulosispirillum alkaliphilum TaxID=3039283 RepID=UPI002A4E99D6|nr:ABC transporter ATP-binding protein [Chitinispirillales bacterium ANBcel5]
MSDNPIIEFKNVCINDNAGTPILENITFSVQKRQKILVQGGSGSGKSTLFLTILGKHRPSEGQVFIDGNELDTAAMQMLRTYVAYLPQEPALGAQTVKDALLLPFSFKANKKLSPTDNILKNTLSDVNLSQEMLLRDISVLSGGEKQRIAIARALLLKRDLLLIDEPASALDEENETAILTLLKQINTTMLVISHNSKWRSAFDQTIQLSNKTATVIPNSRTLRNG